jgi:hypothetical protein
MAQTIHRRHALALIGAAAAAGPVARARAQAARHYAVISLVGDELELVYGNPGVGSNLDRNVRKPMPDADAAFDRIALLALQEEIQRAERGARVSLLGLPPSRLHREPERLFDSKGILLPGSLVDAIAQAGATHVLLLTKAKGDTKVPMVGGDIGFGTLRGLGYYVDNFTQINMVDSGATARGLLAMFVYTRLTLADARTGEILAQRTINAAQSQPTAVSTTGSADPWEALAPQQKFDALRGLLQTTLRHEMPALLGAARR